ncbi:MAG: hypothetical protein HZA50_13870 [Planctomycetes bacterium]|nr:hypothetical protein [Planctomycetota bacterium]
MAQLLVENIPSCLKELDQWVCWRYEPGEKGESRKIPYAARTGRKASSTDMATWCDFEDAVAAAGKYDGIGFVFSDDDGFCGIDLDNCLDDSGNLQDWAKEVIEHFNTYSEISPSGKGLKLFFRGCKPDFAQCTVRGRGPGKSGRLEIFDKERYFTVTGRLWTATSRNVEDRQIELDELCQVLWPGKQIQPAKPMVQPAMSMDERMAWCLKSMLAMNIVDNFDGSFRLFSACCRCVEHDLSVDEALACMCQYAAQRPFPKEWSKGQITKRLRDAEGKCTRGEALSARGDRDGGTLPEILIDTEEHRVVADTIVALRADPDLYQRGGILVRVIRDLQPMDGIRRPIGSPTIQSVPAANLRERMTRFASFIKACKKGQTAPAHPAPWLVSAIEARAEWPGIRHLSGVSDSPVLRADGSVWQDPGYDGQTGVLFESEGVFPTVHHEVNIDDAVAALDDLMEVVCDFRFEAQEHRAAWLAALLTPLGRFAFMGPSPLFLIDANIRGAGKGLLAQVIGRILLGREMPVSSYAHDPDEMRKRITAIAIAGDRMVLMDNLEGAFGNDALDRALTSTRWKDRILGRSEEIDLPLLPVWYATGNNVAVAADTARRVIHIRLDVMDEKPEERTGFRHPDLLGWIGANRGRLLSSAMTILSAYCGSGRPAQGLKPFGSFEGWSDLVRQAVVWVGLPDPCLTRIRLAETSDTSTDALGQLLTAWKEYDPFDQGVVVSEMIGRLYPVQMQYSPKDQTAVAMRAALENLVGCPPGRAPTPKQVGNKFRRLRRQVIRSAYLDFDSSKYNRAGVVWKIYKT